MPSWQNSRSGGLAEAADTFDELERCEVQPPRDATQDKTPARIDQAMSQMMGLGATEIEAIQAIREWRCADASAQWGREMKDPSGRYESESENVQRTRVQRPLWRVRAA